MQEESEEEHVPAMKYMPYDDYRTSDEELLVETRAPTKRRHTKKTRRNNRNNRKAVLHASAQLKQTDKDNKLVDVRRQSVRMSHTADTLASQFGSNSEDVSESDFSSEDDADTLRSPTRPVSLFEDLDDGSTAHDDHHGTSSARLNKLLKDGSRALKKRSRKRTQHKPQGNHWSRFRDVSPPPAKRRKFKNAFGFFKQYIGLAPYHELSSSSAARARFTIETRGSESDRHGVSVRENHKDDVANNLMFHQHHPNMTQAEMARAQACDALVPVSPYLEPMFHKNQRHLKPLVRECKVSKKRIRAMEDLVTLLHREAWGKVPEKRDSHRHSKKLSSFSTSSEKKFLKMYQENAKYPEKNLFKMDNCSAVRSILQHAWGLNFRISEMGRAQKRATTDALEALIKHTPQGEGVNVDTLKAIMAVDSKSTGVQWYLKEKLSAIVHNAYSPSDVPWNFNTESRVKYLVTELRQYYDFLSPVERGTQQTMTDFSHRSEVKDPMTTRSARRLMKETKQRNSVNKISDTTGAADMDTLSKDAAKQIQHAPRLFLRL